MKKEAIHFIFTGGTIDSFYNSKKDTATPNKASVIPDYLQSLRLYEKIKFTEVCMKDSRDLTSRDLKKILQTIKASPCKKIIITHGTYTMSDTARYLKANLATNKKTIVFTGSMVPLVGFSPSDAPFNLGYAMAKIQELGAGFYVCMNGRAFSPDEVVKLLHQGKFISIFEQRGK